ncbi:MAG: protease HtpX [Bdellovibrionales bacterium]|nr:protease HtpX [Bdellovibrionales bacterium]
MATFKRIFLFLAVNVLVMLTISLALNLLGVRPYLTAYGIQYDQLMIFCLVWGMGGAFISLLLSKVIAKWTMGLEIISPNTRDSDAQELLETVHQLAKAAGLPKMPEVGIYDSPEVNAFATGPSRSSSLVAVSTGLLQRMSREERDGVLGHEVAHIANGDMVTMTLVQGVVNAFVMFFSRVLAFAVSQALRSNRDSDSERSSSVGGPIYHIIQFVFEIVFMIAGSMLVAWFSRWREFRADAGGAKLAGREAMIKALEKLRKTIEIEDPNPQPSVQTLKISGRGGFLALFSSHPPLELRIERLKAGAR